MGWDGIYFPVKPTREQELEEIKHHILKSMEIVYATKVGSVWFLAIKDADRIFCGIIPTQYRQHEFMIKIGTEFDGYNGYYDAPMKLINMLTPTEDKLANEWRDKVREKNGIKKSMSNLKRVMNKPSEKPITVSEAKQIIRTIKVKQFDGSFIDNTEKYVRKNENGRWVEISRGKVQSSIGEDDDYFKRNLQKSLAFWNKQDNGFACSVTLQNETGSYTVNNENELNGRKTAPRKKTQKKSPFKLNVRGMF